MDWAHLGIFVVVIIAFFLIMAMVFIWLERRLIGRFQIRLGPNRAGPFGVLQPVADAIKVLIKEDIVPARGDRWVHFLAPIIVFTPILMIFAVIPFGERAILADLNIGILYVVAISSIGTIGVFMAGWGSNNKYSLIGAMRTVAQMVSYEIPLVLSTVGVVLIAGSLSMVSIVEGQSIPFILLQPLGFLIYFLGASAEMNRTPFDLLEAESEIVAGFHTEYSGLKFAMFYLTEYGHALAVSAIVTTLYLSGWMGPGLPAFLWFLIKVFFVFFLVVWVRSTLPRFRVDQLMGFAWKYLFPLALVNIFVTAFEVLLWPDFPWPVIFANIFIAGALIVLWSRLFPLEGGVRFDRYGLGIAKGLALTFRHLFRTPITVQYPEERLNTSKRIRGNELLWDDEACNGCGACARACPVGIINLETRRGPEKGLLVERLDIDMGCCLFCGLCVEACPLGALFMGRGYERATYRRGQLVMDKERLALAGGEPSAYASPQIEAALPEQTLLVKGEMRGSRGHKGEGRWGWR